MSDYQSIPAPNLFLELCKPRGVSEGRWQQFYKDEYIADLISNRLVSKGVLYGLVPNPMGRLPPDDKTHIGLFETDVARCSEASVLGNTMQTSKQFPNNQSMREVTEIEGRNYQLLQRFDPKGLGPACK
jgi:hypothetical protein